MPDLSGGKGTEISSLPRSTRRQRYVRFREFCWLRTLKQWALSKISVIADHIQSSESLKTEKKKAFKKLGLTKGVTTGGASDAAASVSRVKWATKRMF